jgi:hypothetical protein
VMMEARVIIVMEVSQQSFYSPLYSCSALTDPDTVSVDDSEADDSGAGD